MQGRQSGAQARQLSKKLGVWCAVYAQRLQKSELCALCRAASPVHRPPGSPVPVLSFQPHTLSSASQVSSYPEAALGPQPSSYSRAGSPSPHPHPWHASPAATPAATPEASPIGPAAYQNAHPSPVPPHHASPAVPPRQVRHARRGPTQLPPLPVPQMPSLPMAEPWLYGSAPTHMHGPAYSSGSSYTAAGLLPPAPAAWAAQHELFEGPLVSFVARSGRCQQEAINQGNQVAAQLGWNIKYDAAGMLPPAAPAWAAQHPF